MSTRRSRRASSAPASPSGGGRPIWQPLPVSEGGDYAKGATYGEEIRKLPRLGRSRPCSSSTARSTPSPWTPWRSSPSAASPGTMTGRRFSNWFSASSLRTRWRRGSDTSSARPTRRSSRSASIPSSRHSAAASAGATTRRSRSMSRSPRCSCRQAGAARP